MQLTREAFAFFQRGKFFHLQRIRLQLLINGLQLRDHDLALFAIGLQLPIQNDLCRKHEGARHRHQAHRQPANALIDRHRTGDRYEHRPIHKRCARLARNNAA